MSIAKGLARAAKAAKRRNKNKARQGNDLVGNRGEDGSLMTEKDWSNKIREEKQMSEAEERSRPDEALAGSPDADRLVQQLDNNDIKLSDLSKDELASLREQLSASLDETDYLLKTEGWHVILGAVDRDYATFLFDKKYRLIDLLDEVKYRQEELVFDEITKRSTR